MKRRQERLKPFTRKKYFLLLEFVVALSLVLLCIFPLLKMNGKLWKQQQQWCFKGQGERIAAIVTGQIRQQLYERDFSWSELSKGEVKRKESSPVTLLNARGEEIAFNVYYEMEKEHFYTKKDSEEAYLLVRLQIYLEREKQKLGPYISYATIEKKPSPQNALSDPH